MGMEMGMEMGVEVLDKWEKQNMGWLGSVCGV